jgi:hypothetical protein
MSAAWICCSMRMRASALARSASALARATSAICVDISASTCWACAISARRSSSSMSSRCRAASIAARRTLTCVSLSISARSRFDWATTCASFRSPSALKALFSSIAPNGVWSSAVSATASSCNP